MVVRFLGANSKFGGCFLSPPFYVPEQLPLSDCSFLHFVLSALVSFDRFIAHCNIVFLQTHSQTHFYGGSKGIFVGQSAKNRFWGRCSRPPCLRVCTALWKYYIFFHQLLAGGKF